MMEYSTWRKEKREIAINTPRLFEMERTEFNKIKKLARGASGLIVDESQNSISISLYDGDKLKKMVVVMKCDSYTKELSKVEGIIKESESIERSKNKEK